MRQIQAEVGVDRLEHGAVRLRLKSVTGELIGVELSAPKAAAHAAAMNAALAKGDPLDHDHNGRKGGSLPKAAAHAAAMNAALAKGDPLDHDHNGRKGGSLPKVRRGAAKD